MSVDARPSPKPESIWLNLGLNVLAPVLILSLLSKPERLGQVGALLTALAFPLAYGAWDLIRRRKVNFLSGLGLASVLLTGGLGLLRLDPFWFAVKEAAVPIAIAAAALAAHFAGRPPARVFLFQPQIFDVPRIEAALDARGTRAGLDALLSRATWPLAGAFLLSAVLNFGLARWIVRSPGGTEAFNSELARLTALSFPVISLPVMAILMVTLFRLVSRLESLTGLKAEEFLHAARSQAAPPAPPPAPPG